MVGHWLAIDKSAGTLCTVGIGMAWDHLYLDGITLTSQTRMFFLFFYILITHVQPQREGYDDSQTGTLG